MFSYRGVHAGTGSDSCCCDLQEVETEMNPLVLLESVLTSSIPQPHQTVTVGYAAVRPEIVIAGMQDWYPKLKEFALNGSVVVAGNKVAIDGTITAGNDRLFVPVRTTGKYVNAGSVVEFTYPSPFIRDLFHGKWALHNGYEFRMQTDNGFTMPGFIRSSAGFDVVLDIEVRKSGLLGWIFKSRIQMVSCDATGADVLLSRVARKFIVPRLVWGVTETVEKEAKVSRTIETQLRDKLQGVVNDFRLPVSAAFRADLRKKWTLKKCQRYMKQQAGYSGIGMTLAWWMLSSVLKAVIFEAAKTLFDKIQGRIRN